MKLWAYLLAAAALVTAAFGAVYLLGNHPGGARSGVLSKVAWQRMASPGELSQSHSFLEHNCVACHTPVKGVESTSCITCHASDQSLLTRQPTAFHADVKSCVECHIEHQGPTKGTIRMDHSALAKIGLKELSAEARSNPTSVQRRERIASWIGHIPETPHGMSTDVPSLEASLNCMTCHANEDKHRQFFGSDCVQCHSTRAWNIAEFRHPPASSTDCAQCHQGPPSHYMMHFNMISMRIAGQMHAKVDQCFLCHETTSWNDIRGVGWYKHH
jgi:hypothetical protein